MLKGKFAKPKKGKKWMIAGIALVLVAAIGVGIWAVAGSSEPVNVYSFDYLGMTEYWGDSQESYGPVTTDKIQTLYLSDTQTVTEIHVKQGDTVKKGDKLLSFDTTLDSLALERQRLETERIQLKIKEANAELWEIENTRAEEDWADYMPKPTEPDLGAELTKAYQISRDFSFDGSEPEKAMILWMQEEVSIDDAMLDALWETANEYRQKNAEKQPSSASAVPEDVGLTELVEMLIQTAEEAGETVETTEATEATTEATEETTETTLPEETTEATQPEETTEATEPEETTEATAPEETTEATLPEETTAPTEPEIPEVKEFYVVFKVTEENRAMAGRLLWQGMKVSRSESGKYALNFFDAGAVEDHTVVIEEKEEPEQDWEGGIVYTREQLAQMRSEVRKQIKQLEFDLKMAEAEYKIMQRELSDGNIYAEVDGEVVSVLTEEEAKAARQPVVKVSGGGGFYVEGSISELEKENVKPGQEVTINDWNTGMTYTGIIQSIGDFPSGDDSWNGAGNPNASYYPFQVFVDGSADLEAGRYVSVVYSAAAAENGIYLTNAFVRTEQGKSYVYLRGENEKLEKRYVTVGKSLWGSYTQILSGVTAGDWLAFPYGKEVKDGAPAVEGNINDLYSY